MPFDYIENAGSSSDLLRGHSITSYCLLYFFNSILTFMGFKEMIKVETSMKIYFDINPTGVLWTCVEEMIKRCG